MHTLTTQLVRVNEDRCQQLAELLLRQAVPLDQEESTLDGLTHFQIGNYYLLLVAICHQTSPRGDIALEGNIDGLYRRGWDYLTAKFEHAVKADPSLLDVARWKLMTAGTLVDLFRDPTYGGHLIDVEGRAELVRNLGTVMCQNNYKTLDDLHVKCAGRIATGKPNLIDLLRKFRAYDDPVRKKSYFLLSLMKNSGLWTFPDDHLLGPPVDYHEVRGHLRIGTVVIEDESLRQKIDSKTLVNTEEDVAIRSAVFDAIMLLSDLTQFRNPSKLHYLFWNVFRTCCKHDETHCHACPSSCGLPARYVPLAIHDEGPRRCPFSDVCSSKNLVYKPYEHVFVTDYY